MIAHALPALLHRYYTSRTRLGGQRSCLIVAFSPTAHTIFLDRACQPQLRRLILKIASQIFEMDALGVAAGAVSLASFLVQITDSTNKIRSFCSKVKNAPKELSILLQEIEVFSVLFADLASGEGQQQQLQESQPNPAVPACITQTLPQDDDSAREGPRTYVAKQLLSYKTSLQSSAVACRRKGRGRHWLLLDLCYVTRR